MNYVNQHKLESLPLDEFEESQQLCDYPEPDANLDSREPFLGWSGLFDYDDEEVK